MDKFRHGSASGYDYHKCRCDVCVEEKHARDRDYYQRNAERIKARINAHRAAHPQRYREAQRRYREAHPEKRKQKQEYWLAYQRENKEHVNAKNRKWKRANRWRVWFYNWKTAEIKRGQTYAPETLDWIKGLDGKATCTYCGEPAQTIDHVIPRSKGGTNDRENLVPACHYCNRRKNDVSVEEFLRRLREEY